MEARRTPSRSESFVTSSCREFAVPEDEDFEFLLLPEMEGWELRVPLSPASVTTLVFSFFFPSLEPPPFSPLAQLSFGLWLQPLAFCPCGRLHRRAKPL